MPIAPSQPDEAQAPELIDAGTFDRPLTVTCPDCGGALKRFEIGSIVKFNCHIGHTYTAETMAAAQFDETEKVIRAAVRVLNERAEFCRQMAEHTEKTEPALSGEWYAANRQALDRAYALRDLVEQDWITPQVTRSPALAGGRLGPTELSRETRA
jgi:two-component system chemotaxis response regulator CheB